MGTAMRTAGGLRRARKFGPAAHARTLCHALCSTIENINRRCDRRERHGERYLHVGTAVPMPPWHGSTGGLRRQDTAVPELSRFTTIIFAGRRAATKFRTFFVG